MADARVTVKVDTEHLRAAHADVLVLRSEMEKLDIVAIRVLARLREIYDLCHQLAEPVK